MKVLHLLAGLKPSGMERMLVSGAPYFRAAGIESLVVGQGADHPFRSDLEAAGYRVSIVETVKSGRGLKAWRALVAREQPDIVHIHAEQAFAGAVLAVKSSGTPARIVRTVHNVFGNVGRAHVSRRAQAALADRFVSAFVAPSPDVADNERRYGRACKVILNWVEDRFFGYAAERQENSSLTRNSVVIVGNSSPIKNHILALRPISRDDSLFLYIHGDESGASAEERSILDALEAGGRLLHRGVGDPASSLVQASAYLMPSKHEGMPVALAEALTVGIPAIVNDVPGMQWARGLPGVTVVPNNPEAWSRVLSDLRTLVVPGKREPIDFSAARGVGEYVGLYRRVHIEH